MGTAAPPGGPIPTPEQIANFYAIMKLVFSGDTTVNPETETHNALEAAIQVLDLRLTAATAKAKAAWDAIAAIVSPALETDQVIPTAEWQQFIAAATAKQAASKARQALTQFKTDETNWWANASQTVTGTGPNVPAVPVITPDLVSAVNAAVSAANSLGS